jgi:hypothetical protein
MQQLVEPIEMRKNNFSKWFFMGFTALSVIAFAISINQPGNNKWICLGGIVMFGMVFLFNASHKLLIDQQGITIKEIWKPKSVNWNDITILKYDVVYHGHGFQYILTITYGSSNAVISLPVRQYKKDQMQRLFELLDQQCPLAQKNEYFKKQAAGQLGWKTKLKML